MNEQYLSRGKRVDNGEWVQGYYLPRWYSFRKEEPYMNVIVVLRGNSGLADTPFEVDLSTVGQCTGLRDKNGTLIFEGDILHFFLDNDPAIGGDVEYTGPVTWSDGAWFVEGVTGIAYITRNDDECEIIGNIHDTPELIGG